MRAAWTEEGKCRRVVSGVMVAPVVFETGIANTKEQECYKIWLSVSCTKYLCFLNLMR